MENGEVKIVDFYDCEIGVSWCDFGTIMRNAYRSPHFARGQLCGYFSGPPAPGLWPLLSFFASIRLLNDTYYQIFQGNKIIGKIHLEIISKTLRWIDNMQSGAFDVFFLPIEAAENTMQFHSASQERDKPK